MCNAYRVFCPNYCRLIPTKYGKFDRKSETNLRCTTATRPITSMHHPRMNRCNFRKLIVDPRTIKSLVRKYSNPCVQVGLLSSVIVHLHGKLILFMTSLPHTTDVVRLLQMF